MLAASDASRSSAYPNDERGKSRSGRRPQYGDSSTIFMVNTAVSTSTE